MQKEISNTQIMVECAIMLGIATVLSIFPKFSGMWVSGGSITVCSMLPIILAAYRHGTKWGLATGVGFSLLQMLSGFYLPAGGLFAAVAGLLLDYILPFTVIGLAGVFRGKFGSVRAELGAGTVMVMVLRYISHVASGAVLWGSLADIGGFLSAFGAWGQSVLNTFSGQSLYWVYSAIYNAGYMLPELVITTVGAVLISKYALYGMKKTQNA